MEVTWAWGHPRGCSLGSASVTLPATSQIATVGVAAITSNVELGDAPGNVRLSRSESKLPRDSIVNVSQLLTLDRSFLTDRVTRLSARVLAEIEVGVRLVLSL
jgi:mRNA interferase MazF